MILTVYLTAATLASVTTLAVYRWRRGSRSLRWIAGAFASYLVAWTLFSVMDFDIHQANRHWGWTVSYLALTIGPWCEFRFAMELWGKRPRLIRAANILLGLNVVLQLLVRERIAVGYSHAGTAATVVQGVMTISILAFTFGAAVVLWKAGTGKPRPVRVRSRVLSMTIVVFFIAQAATGVREVPFLLVPVAFMCGAIVLLGLAAMPPRLLRDAWQAQVMRRMMSTLGSMDVAAPVDELLENMLPLMAEAAGAEGVVLRDADTDSVLGTYGDVSGTATTTISSQTVSIELMGTPQDPLFDTKELDFVTGLTHQLGFAIERGELIQRELQANAELRRLAELREDFVAVASHELRTPVTSITGFTSTLLDLWDRIDESERISYLELVDEQARRLADMTEDLLILSAVESGEIRPSTGAVSIRPIAAEILLENGLDDAAAGIDIAESLQCVIAAHHLRRILANLIGNARKYGALPITVAATATDGVVRITVRDAGPGVPPEFHDHIFERYSRGERSTGPTSGYGLGLFIVRRLTELYGGNARLDEQASPGATFVVELPCAGASAGTVAGAPARSSIASAQDPACRRR